MRIVSGKYRNTLLASPAQSPKKRPARNRQISKSAINSLKPDLFHPMGDRQRSGMFNALFSARGRLVDAKVLDAYAGTGSVGLEALSRGAAHATFLEKNPAAANLIRENIARLKLPKESYRIIQKSVEKYDGGESRIKSKLKTSKKPLSLDSYDIIFADPPYEAVSADALVSLTKFLVSGGLFALSCPSDFPTETFATSAGLKLLSSHAYARAKIAIFKKP